MPGKRKPTAKSPLVRQARPITDRERAFLQSVGEKLKALRVERGLTAEDLGAAIGIKANAQFHRESGARAMPLEDVYRYAVALKCKPADLLLP